MYIKRNVELQIKDCLESGLVAIIYGARQTGKTTLAKVIAGAYDDNLYLNCDERDDRESLINKTSTELKASFGKAKMLIIDEAQRVKDIGVTAKLIHDQLPEVRLLLTGSSSIDLANTMKEPLTGRSREFILYPFAATEVASNSREVKRFLEKSLIYGGYPNSWFENYENASHYLRRLANNYLYRDAFPSNTIFDRTILDYVLKKLAYQLGNEVSYSEIGQDLSINKQTVMRYIFLLEEAFIVFRLPQYRKNQRNEVGKLRKVYFYDLGVRNALINNFNPIALRTDKGALFENYCIVERFKYLQKEDTYARHYYWRSKTKQEIDLIEEIGADTRAYEFKYSKSKINVPSVFAREYSNVNFSVITKDDLERFCF